MRYRVATLALLVVVGIALLGVQPVHAALTYTFTTLDFPGAFATQALGINDEGVVVGTYMAESPEGQNIFHGFVYEEGTFTTLDYPRNNPPSCLGCAPPGTALIGINDAGAIFGVANFQGGQGGGPWFVYKDGVFSDVSAMPSLASPYLFDITPNFPGANIFGMNERGEIVGSYNDNGAGNPPPPNRVHGFIGVPVEDEQ